MQVGFIGLGSQGAPMARRILDGGYPLTVWGRRRETVEPFAAAGAHVAADPAGLGAASDVVGICVVTDADVEQVVLGADGVLAGMRPGGIVVIHSTVHPATCRRVAEAARERGIAVVDAPVSGGGGAAAEGKLLVMVGGDDESVARCRPVLETFGDPIVHLGPLGSGQLAKLLNNLVFTAQVAVALDTVEFGESLGVDRDALAQIIGCGSGASRALAILAASDFDLTGLRQVGAPLLRKDVDLTLAVADEAGVPEPALAPLAERALTRLLG